jgi:putative hemolysin
VAIGRPLQLKHGEAADPDLLLSTARRAVDDLANGMRRQRKPEPPAIRERRERPGGHTLAAEIDRLPAAACLVESGRFRVYCASAPQIPHTLMEIGRLREVTYRAVGEGTGKSRDLDAFDGYYVHLFAWDRQLGQLAGAYRLADVDTIVRSRGIGGLYTRQLFAYDERFVAALGPCLELGRSWIRAEYQRHSNALLMLWRGIGRFIVERSRARALFGPVSVSARYSDISHLLLRSFLAQNHLDHSLAAIVEGVHPQTRRPVGGTADVVVPRTIEEADTLVSRLEDDGKGVPVLLRQYLKLNAKLIAFSIDPSFGDALDALMMVDLKTVDAGILRRYLGVSAARVLASAA